MELDDETQLLGLDPWHCWGCKWTGDLTDAKVHEVKTGHTVTRSSDTWHGPGPTESRV